MSGDHYSRESILFFDVAHEGAQVRAIGAALERLEGIVGLNPRSIVVLAGDQLSQAAAQLVVDMRTSLTIPIVVTRSLPNFVGALDVVIGISEHADQPWLAQALITARGRGCHVIAAVPARGPLAEDVASAAVVCGQPSSASGFSAARVIYLLETVLALVGSTSGTVGEAIDAATTNLYEAADIIDEEVSLVAPDRPVEVNPARNLRAFIEGSRIVHTGTDHRMEAVAHFNSQLFSVRGFASGFAELEQFPDALGGDVTGNTQDIFRDPFLDGESSLLPLKTVIWAGSGKRELALPSSLPVVVEDHGEANVGIRLIVHALAATVFDAP